LAFTGFALLTAVASRIVDRKPSEDRPYPFGKVRPAYDHEQLRATNEPSVAGRSVRGGHVAAQLYEWVAASLLACSYGVGLRNEPEAPARRSHETRRLLFRRHLSMSSLRSHLVFDIALLGAGVRIQTEAA
jgi:hypothetical protein